LRDFRGTDRGERRDGPAGMGTDGTDDTRKSEFPWTPPEDGCTRGDGRRRFQGRRGRTGERVGGSRFAMTKRVWLV